MSGILRIEDYGHYLFMNLIDVRNLPSVLVLGAPFTPSQKGA